MTEDIKLEYLPAPDSIEAIERFNASIALITGRTPTGTGFLRVGWGMDITKFYGGTEQVKYFDPNGRFVGLPFYVLEAWSAPEVYDPAEWQQLRYEGELDVLGAYPRTGVWDFLHVCRREDFTAQPLGEEILATCRNWRYHATRGDARRRALADYKAFQDKKKQLQQTAFEEYQAAQREELARELAKPETNSAFSLPSVDTTAVADAPGYVRRTGSGLIIPESIR